MKNSIKTKKTVLMICPFARPNIGGVESHLDKLIDYLTSKNIFIYLITYQPLTVKAKGESIEYGKNYKIIRTNWFGYGLFNKIEWCFPLTFLYLVPGLLYKSVSFYIKKYKEINIIHAHGFAAAFVGKILNLIHTKKTVISTHAVYNLSSRKILSCLVRWVLSSYGSILAVGEISRKELVQIGIENKRIKIHKNWIDTSMFKPYNKIESRQLLNISKNNFVVLYVGRLIVKKGVLNLIKVAKMVSDEIIFIILGNSGTEVQKVEESAREINNLIHVNKLTYSVNNKRILARYYSSADIFLLPSTYNEGFASVVLEGIGCGTPIIATNQGCIPEIIDDSIGVMINPTVKNLKNTIEFLYNNRSELAKRAKKCRSYAVKYFSRKNADIIINSYYEQ